MRCNFLITFFFLCKNVYFIYGNETIPLTSCPSEWQAATVCGSTNCYRKFEIPVELRATAVETNICKTFHPDAHVVSIHCQEEDNHLGLFIATNMDWSWNGFHWEDETAFDFDGWDHLPGVPDQPDNQVPVERNVEFRTNMNRRGWHDLPLQFFEAVVCKIVLRRIVTTTMPSINTTTTTTPTTVASVTTTTPMTKTTASVVSWPPFPWFPPPFGCNQWWDPSKQCPFNKP